MVTSASNQPLSERRSIRRELWISCGIWIGLVFIIDGLFAMIYHGGIFSFLGALAAANSKVQLIDVDKSGLLFPIVCVASVIVTSIFVCLNVNINKHRNLTLAVLIASGFIIDGVYGSTIIDHLMSAEGYTHCISGDHVVGNGKGRVYFTDYALTPADCPSSKSKAEVH